ncbi:DUF4397 domain-containing protein [Nocardioides guangzhouensis]|uniref:DUF4397 domain-containing protein n=1 Tax=Nocardioides guangzhouensis TaxID=2497878 RepID=A0A4V1XZK3_9ACTN|nr:DUF4397 domain-containing protein [Nocardioides guangzhouensis]RYP87049.1 DUF4397 domain-containing protein [Nocardioides guangzhouensis]
MRVGWFGVAGAALVLTLSPVSGGGAAERAAAPAAVSVVQAVPGQQVTVTVDGTSVEGGAAGVGDVLGPLELTPGEHALAFSDGSGSVDVTSTLEVKAGSTSDVVLHLPADVGGAPVVNSYVTPTGPIGPGKARVLVAHTATVAPADVRVDGKVVFTNIANGEFATADVPAGTHVVELLPTGQKSNPILGPIDLRVTAGTVSKVYAVGNPRDRSMQVILHSATLRPDGSVVPDTIRTGSAGLAADIPLHPFGPH